MPSWNDPVGAVEGQVRKLSGPKTADESTYEKLKGLDPTTKPVNKVDPNAGGGIKDVKAPSIATNPELTHTTIGKVGGTTAATIDQVAAERARGTQEQLMAQLAAQARGEGPSVVGQQLQQAQEANLAATRAQLASTRGGANAAIARQTMQTAADIQAKTAQDAAMARLQEQLQAQGLLASTAAGVRSQDEAQAANNAGFVQQAALANMQKDLQLAVNQGQITAAEAQQIFSAEVTRNAQQAQLLQQANIVNQGKDLSVAGLGQSAAQFNAGQQTAKDQMGINIATGLISGVAGLGGQIATAPAGSMVNPTQPAAAPVAPVVAPAPQPVSSDQNLKKDIKGGSQDVKSFLDAISAESYSYKDKKDGAAARYVSPMAQDLEKHPLGDSMVVDTPRGKMVDYQRASGFLLAATADINKRLESLEKGKK